MSRELAEVAADAQGALLAVQVHLKCGVIPLLEHLQAEHPEWEEESVFRCLEELRENRDEIDPIETELREMLPQKRIDPDDPIWKEKP